jgi:hypothetical protein
VLPNCGHGVVDETTTPPTIHIVGVRRDMIIVIAMTAVPLALILIGTLRASRVAIPGWILLGILLLSLFLM